MKCYSMTYLLEKSVVVTACLLSLFETGRKKVSLSNVIYAGHIFS